MKKIAIFASGTGSNARKIVEHFEQIKDCEIALIVSNRGDALVLKMAEEYNIDQLVIDRPTFYETEGLLDVLEEFDIDFIALAGFLWLIPEYLVEAFDKKMINIHPALLPKYGGKGMYGKYVHQAVKEAGDAESGITIHYVNTKYDDGDIVFQARCPIDKRDNPEEIARKVLKLEHEYFPKVLEKLLEE